MENKKMNAEEVKKAIAEQVEKNKAGVMKLKKPMRAGGKDLTELMYDFSELTAWEYAAALDSDANNTNSFRLSKRQAVALFAAAAAKKTPEVDEKDVKERLSIEDGIQAANIATVFFICASRAGE